MAEYGQLLSNLKSETSKNLSIQSAKGRLFAIEGNIGCGKSTFVQLLKQKIPEARWIQQPVTSWQNVNNKGINILDKYYKQPNRWGFTFQIYAIFTRIKAMKEAMQREPGKILILERSILADRYVFSELMKDLGYMNEAEYCIFESLYKDFEEIANVQELKIIYLKCSPEKCHLRIEQRKRPQQDEIPLSYLNLIHAKHQNWLKGSDPSRVLTIDTNEDFKEDQNKIQAMLAALKVFFTK